MSLDMNIYIYENNAIQCVWLKKCYINGCNSHVESKVEKWNLSTLPVECGVWFGLERNEACLRTKFLKVEKRGWCQPIGTCLLMCYSC